MASVQAYTGYGYGGVHDAVTNARGLHIKGWGNTVPATATNEIGLDIEDIDSFTNSWAIRTGKGTVQFGDDVKIQADSRKLYLGAADDASITYDGDDLLVDPRVVGSGNTSFTGNIGVGTANCQYIIDVDASGTENGLRMYSDSYLEWKLQVNAEAAASERGMFRCARSRGTKATPTAILDGDYLFSFLADGYTGTAYLSGGEIDCIATQNWDGGARGAKWQFQGIANGAVSQSVILTLEGNGVLNVTNDLEITGDIIQSGTTGGFNRQVAEAAGTATAATTFDIQVNVPTGSRILGCQLRVDTALTSSDGGTTWTAAYLTGATQQIGAGLAFAQDTKHSQMFDANAATDIASGEVDIRVTCDAAKTFIAGGVVRAIVYYENFTAMANV